MWIRTDKHKTINIAGFDQFQINSPDDLKLCFWTLTVWVDNKARKIHYGSQTRAEFMYDRLTDAVRNNNIFCDLYEI